MTRRNEVVVGATIILAIIMLIFGTIWMKGLKFGKEEVTVRARFREVGQLLDGSSVKYRGVPIGRVESIELEPSGNAVIVTMSVEGDIKLPDDKGVLLAPESMFGDWQAEIVSRSNLRGYDFTESLNPDVLPGYSLPDMSRLTQVADEIAGNLASISSRFDIAFTDETAKDIRLAIENIQDVSEQLTGLVGKQQVALDEVAANLARTSESAGQAAATMQRAFAEIETAIGNGKLTNIVVNVERATARTDSLAAVLVDASRDLRSTAMVADSTFRRVGSIASAVERGEGSLGRLLRDTTLYTSLVDTNLEVQALLRDIRRNPRKYINLTIF